MTTKANTPRSTSKQILILIDLLDGAKTSAELETATPYLIWLANEKDLVTKRENVVTNKRGRPAVRWGLTDKGRKRARRAVARQSVAA